MSINLTTTSHLVLGLVARLGPCTPYDLKRAVCHGIEYFWAFPHSQLYAEPERLKRAGFLEETREREGRRRRLFTITEAGREALSVWLKEPPTEPTEIRDLGLLKLYFGELGDGKEVAALAESQRQLHERRLAEYEAICETRRDEATPGYRLAIVEMGVLFERAAVAFWSAVAEPSSSQIAPSQILPSRKQAARKTAALPTPVRKQRRGRLATAIPKDSVSDDAREVVEVIEEQGRAAESTQLPEHLL